MAVSGVAKLSAKANRKPPPLRSHQSLKKTMLKINSPHFIYDPYEIASFAAGTIDIFVPYKIKFNAK